MSHVRGGEKINAFLQNLVDKLREPATLKVGFLQGATYPDGTPVAMVAAIQNYGAPRAGIPPRPFFDNMVAKYGSEWPEAIGNLLKANDYDLAKTFELAGQAISGQLRQSIVDTNAPPLAESTIRRKGFDKPLVDTGHMLNSVDFEVKT